MSDTDRIASTLAWGLMEGVWYIAYLLFAIVTMFLLNWKLALGVMVIVPVLVLSSMYFQKKLVFRLVGKCPEFVFNARAIAGTDSGNLSGKQRRVLKPGTKYVMDSLVRMENITRHLSSLSLRRGKEGKERKLLWRLVTELKGKRIQIH